MDKEREGMKEKYIREGGKENQMSAEWRAELSKG